jgi:hypothetical protein
MGRVVLASIGFLGTDAGCTEDPQTESGPTTEPEMCEWAAEILASMRDAHRPRGSGVQPRAGTADPLYHIAAEIISPRSERRHVKNM